MIFVKWDTIVRWKRRLRETATAGVVYPYQYSSDSKRFLQIQPADVLWVISTPRFGAHGQVSLHGRARPPAVMARLRVLGLCCNRANELSRAAQARKPVCLEGELRKCDEAGVLPQGVHPDSYAWSIVVIGEKDPERNPTPLQTTYPALYNFFSVLHRLEFATERGVRCLKQYLEFVERGDYLRPTQREAKRAGKQVRDPGPYAPLGQFLQTLRRLTPQAAHAMDEFHERAVLGKRIFLSYKWSDVESFARNRGQSRVEWVKDLNHRLEDAGYSSWLDHHQILADRDIGDLLEEVLSDAVHQSVVFLALLSENYGTGWTRKEWERASRQLLDKKRKDKLLIVVLECGGDPARLDLTASDTHPIPRSPTAEDVVQAIMRLCAPGSTGRSPDFR